MKLIDLMRVYKWNCSGYVRILDAGTHITLFEGRAEAIPGGYNTTIVDAFEYDASDKSLDICVMTELTPEAQQIWDEMTKTAGVVLNDDTDWSLTAEQIYTSLLKVGGK